MRRLDLTGNRYGKLTVLSRAESKLGTCGKKFTMWLCQCDCGRTKEIMTSSLVKGSTRSCGCLQKGGAIRYGFSNKEKLYAVWRAIKKRCRLKNDPSYNNYGGRGIDMCDEWYNSYIIFREWCLSNGYEDGLTIDRIDNNGNYEPNNCRFATRKEQSNNRNYVRKYNYKGKEYSVTQLAEEFNISVWKLRHRLITKKWSVEKALTHQHEDKGE